MIPEERNSYTLTEEEAIIFATANLLTMRWKMNFFSNLSDEI